MKKILCLLVALLLVGSLGLAEAIDLSSMTDEELLVLKEQVDCAINERGISAAPHLLSGVYTAGSDITPPPANTLFTFRAVKVVDTYTFTKTKRN